MADRTETIAANFNAIRISIASPEQIKGWSHGEVTKPETINYRTLRPEKDGLFCERLFGPTKDWECFCGKYKRIRYRGVVCDRCGVEVTRAKVRRERMGHISLAAPVAHIWFSKTNPSRLGLLLDLSPRNLERVLYFAQHIIIAVDDTVRQEAVEAEQLKYDLDVEKLRETAADTLSDLNRELLQLTGGLQPEISNNIAMQSGRVKITESGITLIANEIFHPIPESAEIMVDDGESVEPGMILASVAQRKVHALPESAEIMVDDGEAVEPGMILASVAQRKVYALPNNAEILVDHGDEVAAGNILASVPNPDGDSESTPVQINADTAGRVEITNDAIEISSDQKITATDAGYVEITDGGITVISPEEIIATIAGCVEISNDNIAVIESHEYPVPSFADILVTDGDAVRKTEKLFDISPRVESLQQQIIETNNELAATEKELDTRLKAALDDLNDIQKMKLLAESRYRDLSDRYPYVFKAGMGAEAILEILSQIDLEAMRDQLINDMHSTSGQRRQKAIKRLRVVESFRQSGGPRGDGPGEGSRVENMILTMMPVLPPELRPMVQLDGGRFATSDLNDLYRRVINRNNRLKRLMSLGAPEIIIRNEKRMLQEAVDALIDNGRRGRPIQGSHNHKLKSLSDLLRGKQGRFRQNLLGKRVDYSGRSVIVVGPELKMDECGLPRRMALELFKPFVMYRLVMLGIAPNIKNAKRMVDRARGEVWDILEDVIKDHPVLLNRAPTLHRLGIQAFMPKLIDGNAIQIHPLVCSAFNADFDGDQMAVHVPLSSMAVLEARETMLSTHNMLSPASGEPLVAATLDMVMGSFYPGEEKANGAGAGMSFKDRDEAYAAHEKGVIELHSPIYVHQTKGSNGNWRRTTLGRILFNEVLPAQIDFINKRLNRDELNKLTSEMYQKLTNEEMANVLDNIKNLGFRYATTSSINFSSGDIIVPPEKSKILAEADEKIEQYKEEYEMGLISEEERRGKVIEAWAEAKDKVDREVNKQINEYDSKYGSLGTGGDELRAYDVLGYGGLGLMVISGTKGNTSQITQMAGMRGLMSRPRGGIIELPVKSSFREGLSPLEYFISTHGARKGLTDTALNTANSGYLTRRLVDIAQEVIVLEDDCETGDAYTIPFESGDVRTDDIEDRVKGRYAAADVEVDIPLILSNGRNDQIKDRIKCWYAADTIADLQTGEILVSKEEKITESTAKKIQSTLEQAIADGILEPDKAIVRVILVFKNQMIDLRVAKKIQTSFQDALDARILMPEDAVIPVRSPLICKAARGVCRKCYGWLSATAKPVEIGQAVGIIAAQSIGEPGTQLTMRTFHTGGVANVTDITTGLPRVEEIFEARIPKYAAIVTDIDGEVEIRENEETRALRVAYSESVREAYPLPDDAVIRVEDGDLVEQGAILAYIPEYHQHPLPDDAKILVENGEEVQAGMILASVHKSHPYPLPDGAEVLVDDGKEVQEGMTLASIPNSDVNSESPAVPIITADAGRVEVTEDAINVISAGEEIAATESGRVEISENGVTVISVGEEIAATESGRVEISENVVTLIWEDTETREYVIPGSAYILVNDGDRVAAGAPITSGPLNPHDLLRIMGKEALQAHLIDQVQAVYQSQGVSIHDKHIEIILRQMLRRVQVREPGDTEFIPGEVVDKFAFQEQVERVLAEGGEPATAEQVLLGVTRASLRTDSFLSAASFQETTRVLTEAAVRGQQDYLLGLKENVIIGRLIPAQVEIPGMAELLKPPPAFDLAAMAPGGWLRGPAPGDSESDAAGLNLFAPDTDDDGFERMAQAVARTYAREDDDEEEDDFFDDDDDDDDETDAATVAPAAEE